VNIVRSVRRAAELLADPAGSAHAGAGHGTRAGGELGIQTGGERATEATGSEGGPA
jgi:hypothetical protein